MTETSRVAAAVICGDDAKDRDWRRLLGSLEGHCDDFVLAFNGTGELPQNLVDAISETTLTSTVVKSDWRDDFGYARQQSFEAVPEGVDWILWIDTDDTLVVEHPDGLKGILSELKPETRGIFCAYDYAVDPDSGEVLVEQWRERVLSTKTDWQWVYPIHEVCHGRPGIQYSRRYDLKIRHHRTSGHNDKATRTRNRRILARWRKAEPDHPRAMFYFANEVFAEVQAKAQIDGVIDEGECEAAIKLYRDYIKITGWDDEAYVANARVAEVYRLLGRNNAALDIDLQGIKLFPTWPDSYIGVAQTFMAEQDWEKCRFFADLCLTKCSKPETPHALEPANLDLVPLVLRGIALQELGREREALEDFAAAEKLRPSEELSKRIIELTRSIASGRQTEPPEDPMLRLKGTKPDRSIAFVHRPLFEPWHPELAKKGGIGGAETCVIELAPRFVRDGWRVAVYGTPGDYRGVDSDGVEWWRNDEWDPNERFTVCVSSRAPEIFDAKPNAQKKLLWMHDVNVGDEMSGNWGDRLADVDKVIGLSDWHIEHLRRLYGIDPSKLAKIPNGVDVSRFDGFSAEGRQKGKFVWSSSPDRGLDHLMSMWPIVKREFPESELHVFYGWEAIDKILDELGAGAKSHPLWWLRDDITRAWDANGGEKGGLFWHDRVDQKTLAKHMLTMDAWLYPTDFLETYCITAVEMQLAGVMPITSACGALPETAGGYQVHESDSPKSIEFQSAWLRNLNDWMTRDEGFRERARTALRETNEWRTWDDAYEQWKVQLAKLSVWGELVVT